MPRAVHTKDSAPPVSHDGQYAQLGRLSMYYQVYGSGQPMLLLHGGGVTIEQSFAKQLAYFSAHRLLIAPEQQGHGRTRDIDAPLDYVAMTDDTAELLKQLRLKNVDVLGWSDGGILGLFLAAQYPKLVRRLVVTGASTLPIREAFVATVVREFEAEGPETDSPSIAIYSRRFADPVSHYPVFAAKIRDLWLHHPTATELGPEVLARIKVSTLVMDGDRESARLEHTISMYRNLPKAELLIVPGTGHDTLGEHPEWLNPIILDFLDRRSDTPKDSADGHPGAESG